MSRLMSVAFTEQAVIERRKTVTRRAGWTMLTPTDRLTLCRKVMGRRHADGYVEPLVRLVDVEVVDVRREPLNRLIEEPGYGAAEMILEGFPGLDPAEFVQRYFTRAQRIHPDQDINRIEWRYLCTECRNLVDLSDPRAGHGLCASCLHDALRSGWAPGGAA